LIGESLALVRDKPYKILEGYSWRALGKVYLAQKNYQQAQAALQQAYQIFVETGLPEEMAETKALFVSDPAI
jgi:tetratricopeptide (TPR) repeat protein